MCTCGTFYFVVTLASCERTDDPQLARPGQAWPSWAKRGLARSGLAWASFAKTEGERERERTREVLSTQVREESDKRCQVTCSKQSETHPMTLCVHPSVWYLQHVATSTQ